MYSEPAVYDTSIKRSAPIDAIDTVAYDELQKMISQAKLIN